MRLTNRGTGFLVTGAGLALIAASAGSLALARISALSLGLVLIALVWVVGSQRRALGMRLRRRVDPPRPTVAQVAKVHLELTAGRLGTWMRLRERSGAQLQRSAVQASGPGRRSWSYQIRPSQRGYHPLGPATVVHEDPLGLLRWPRQADAGGSVLVWPQTVRLDGIVQLVDLHGAEQATFGLPEPSVEDLTLREYVRGDDVRRVHWRSSARQGQLMVRADEPSRPPVVDVLLDLGRGPGATWALSACASLALALTEVGLPVRVHVCRQPGLDAEPVVHPVTCAERADVLDVLAPATPTLSGLRAQQRRGLRLQGTAVFAVLHARDPALMATLAPLAARRQAAALLVTDRHEDRIQTGTLAEHGWSLHVATARAGTSGIAQAWSHVLDQPAVR